jgi:hypothetical protein
VRYQFADLNGDGLPDAVEIPNAGGDARIAINTGRGFLPPRAANLNSDSQFGESSETIDPGFRIVDVNLDGRADVLYLSIPNRGYFTNPDPSPRSLTEGLVQIQKSGPWGT